jgi:hypothetical protein
VVNRHTSANIVVVSLVFILFVLSAFSAVPLPLLLVYLFVLLHDFSGKDSKNSALSFIFARKSLLRVFDSRFYALCVAKSAQTVKNTRENKRCKQDAKPIPPPLAIFAVTLWRKKLNV